MMLIGGGRSIREVGVVAVYAAVALPSAALIPLISTVGVPIAVGVTSAIACIALAGGRERVSVLRGRSWKASTVLRDHQVFQLSKARDI